MADLAPPILTGAELAEVRALAARYDREGWPSLGLAFVRAIKDQVRRARSLGLDPEGIRSAILAALASGPAHSSDAVLLPLARRAVADALEEPAPSDPAAVLVVDVRA